MATAEDGERAELAVELAPSCTAEPPFDLQRDRWEGSYVRARPAANGERWERDIEAQRGNRTAAREAGCRHGAPLRHHYDSRREAVVEPSRALFDPRRGGNCAKWESGSGPRRRSVRNTGADCGP